MANQTGDSYFLLHLTPKTKVWLTLGDSAAEVLGDARESGSIRHLEMARCGCPGKVLCASE